MEATAVPRSSISDRYPVPWGGPIVGRSTADASGYPAIPQFQAVVAMSRLSWFAKPLDTGQHRANRLTVPREDTSRAIAAVCSRSQAANQQPGIVGTEAGHRLAPVFLVLVRLAFFASNFFPPGTPNADTTGRPRQSFPVFLATFSPFGCSITLWMSVVPASPDQVDRESGCSRNEALHRIS